MIRVAIKGKNFGATPILGRIEFEIAKGETVALVGPSGIGKSTLLRLVAGIDTGFDGSVERPDALAMVFQEPTLLPWRTALDNLRIVHPDLSDTAAFAAMEKVGLSGKEQEFPGQLSLGQQRRLSLARAFVGKPDLLIMDEPFVSLDPDTAETMMRLTETLISGQKPATLFVTHAMSEAQRLAQRVLSLRASAEGAILETQSTYRHQDA
ncbi:MAG: ATP-binding cassette domain-containing protein [Pseudomonadota bacterium]